MLRRGISLLPLALMLARAGIVAPPAGAQNTSSLESAASELSAAIRKASRNEPKDTKILVLDFTYPDGSRSELGLRLADQFADLLAARSDDYLVLSREDLRSAVARDKVWPDVMQHHEAVACYAHEFRASILVEGALAMAGSDYKLHVTASRLRDHKKKIFEKDVRVSPPAGEDALGSQHSSSASSNSGGAKDRDWELPQAGTSGYSNSACAFCPGPRFTSEAVRARLQGTVLLRIRIEPDGHPANITVLKGLPCRMNEQAINAVSRWRLTPVLGPGGGPTAVTALVEVTFRLY